jgi:hypothetical protein
MGFCADKKWAVHWIVFRLAGNATALFLSWLAGWEEKTHLRNAVVASRSVME